MADTIEQVHPSRFALMRHLCAELSPEDDRAIKDHVLADDRVDAEEAAWLRTMLFADGKITDEERKFLHELRGESGQMSLEFAALFVEAMKFPQERHTCG